MAKTRDFSEVIRKELAGNPQLRAEVEKQRLHYSIATLIFNEREKAGLTQKELATRVGTHQSVIARLEDANYEGHSLSMAWRIADALGSELKLDFVPKTQAPPTTVEIFFGDFFEADVKVESSMNTPLTSVA